MMNIFKNKRKGSLTVEATLVLPVVLISILFFVNFINVYLEHTCIQQALNNTAKKISRNAYLVYRFSGEEEYTEFINNLNSEEFTDTALISKAGSVIEDYNAVEDNFKDITDSFSNFVIALRDIDLSQLLRFKFKEFWDQLMEVPKKGKIIYENVVETQKSSKKLIKDIDNLGKKNAKYIILQTLYDELDGEATTKFVSSLFTKYTKDLRVAVQKIDNRKIASTDLNNDEGGTFKLYLTYTFKNPFALLNSKSLEYSMINREIRMFHIVTVSPFVGKSGTSLKEMHDIHHSASGHTFSGGWGPSDDGTDG